MDSGKTQYKSKDLPLNETDILNDKIPGSIYRLMALLNNGPKSGYDISSEVASEELSSWKDSFGNIYPNLRKMVTMGLAEKQRDDFKGRKRVYYSLTDMGRELLDRWLQQPAGRTPVKSELLFKLRFSPHLGVDVVLDHLTEYMNFCKMNHPMYEKWIADVMNSNDSGLEYEVTRLTSDFWYRFTRTLLEWSEDTVKRLEEYRKENAPKGGGSCPDTPSSHYYAPSV